MPPVDPAELRKAQTEVARAQLKLDKARADQANLRLALTTEQARLERAAASGDQAAVRRAQAAVEQAGSRLAAVAAEGLRFERDLAERLDRFKVFDIDAPADIPLLLLPLRLETRFAAEAGRQLLRIRIFPDEIHLDRSAAGLAPEEEAAGRAYWSALFAAPDDADAAGPWTSLKTAVGRDRARHVARATRPINPDQRGTGAAPAFPETAALQRRAARPRLLPERFVATAWQGGQRLRARGAIVDPALQVGLLGDDSARLRDQEGLRVLEGTEWLHDYALALQKGMAIDLPLPRRAPIERLYVYGIRQSWTPAQASAELETLLAAHDGAGRLFFVPQGAPTNNTEADEAAWDRWKEPEPLPLSPPTQDAQSNGRVAAAALGAADRLLAELPGADLREQEAAAAMNAALWPATWGYFLETLDDGQEALSPRLIEGLRRFHQQHLRGGGALPALAVGPQPYGLLPFCGFGRGFSTQNAPAVETELERLARKMLPNWLAGLGKVPRLDGTGDAATVLKIFGHAPQSWGVRARKCLSRDFISKIEATTQQARPAAEIEGLLNQLITESLGNLSFTYGAGSLDAESRPVALPYADPARDADFLAALLEDRAPGAISSVFQALVSLGWARVRAVAKPGQRFAEALELAQSFDAGLTRRLVSLAQSERPAPAEDYAAVLNAIPDVGDMRLRRVNLAGLQGDAAERVIAATSAAERRALAIRLAEEVTLARRASADMRQGLETLLAHARQPGGGDFTRLVAETLDTASHRLDAWILALSWARFSRQRTAVPKGLAIGAFGWLLDLKPQPRRTRDGGFVAAPTLEQATTAGILRSAYLAHSLTDSTGGAFAIDLSSARVRRAQQLLEGVANGQPVGALLGYNFERRLKEAGCERFVLTFRELAPLVTGRLTEGGSPTVDPAAAPSAGANVTDMTRLLERWNDSAEGQAFIFGKLNTRPTQNDYLDASVPWPPLTPAQEKAIEAAIAEAVADADAIADLLLAESVHQLAQGNLQRASATLDAAGRGEAAPPDDLGVIASHGPGTVVTHRLIAVAAPGRGWPGATGSPRATVCPELEAWAAARLPDPSRVPLGLDEDGDTVTLAHTGLSALDFAALARDAAQLAGVLRARGRLANPEATFPEAGAGQVSVAEAALTAAALQELLDQARPLDASSLGLPGSRGWRLVPDAALRARQRLDQAAGQLQGRLQTLSDLLSAPEVVRQDLDRALLALTDFGIALPQTTGSRTADIAMLALREGDRRLGEALALADAPDTPETVAALGRAIFGDGLPLPLSHHFRPDDPAELSGDRPLAALQPGSVQRFLADMGSVRRPLAAFQRLGLLSAINGSPPDLVVRQLCGLGENPPDHWIGAGLPADLPSPTCPVVGIIADAPDGLDLGGEIAGILIDDWTEIMPKRRPGPQDGPATGDATAGVVLHADAPASEPPQALLLGFSPDGKRWTEDGLCAFLDDVLELAQARLISLETLPLAARILPAIYTQSWSLQGTPVIDWSKLRLDARLMARSDGLKHFTMIREV